MGRKRARAPHSAGHTQPFTQQERLLAEALSSSHRNPELVRRMYEGRGRTGRPPPPRTPKPPHTVPPV